MKIIAVIPARYASTRFPGKPLVDILGKPMIQRVYEQVKQAKTLSDVIIATDDERIFKAVESFGGKVMMTSAQHKNGTERCAEVADKNEADVIINIQGDEPFIEPEQIDLLAGLFSDSDTRIGTLVKQENLTVELKNHSRIKVVLNKNMEALYFSRSLIPFMQSSGSSQYYKHIGIYAYSKQVLQQLVKLAPTPLEIAESLEQLRWLENGYKIKCALTEHESRSVDTPEDLAAILTTKG